MMSIRELTMDASKVDNALLDFVFTIIKSRGLMDSHQTAFDFMAENYKAQECAVSRLRILKKAMEGLWAADRIQITDMELFMDKLYDLGLPFHSQLSSQFHAGKQRNNSM